MSDSGGHEEYCIAIATAARRDNSAFTRRSEHKTETHEGRYEKISVVCGLLVMITCVILLNITFSVGYISITNSKT